MRDQVILEFLAMPALTAQRLLDYDGDSAPPAAVYDPWTGHAPSLQIWSLGTRGAQASQPVSCAIAQSDRFEPPDNGSLRNADATSSSWNTWWQ